MTRKLRMGMFGGGKGAFIGAIHRCAAFMDNQIELVCGCFSSNPEKSLESGRELMLDDDRIYSTYQEMIEKEAQLPEDKRMDFISIVTPNHLHFGPAKMAMLSGRSEGAQRNRPEHRQNSRIDPYLFRISYSKGSEGAYCAR